MSNFWETFDIEKELLDFVRKERTTSAAFYVCNAKYMKDAMVSYMGRLVSAVYKDEAVDLYRYGAWSKTVSGRNISTFKKYMVGILGRCGYDFHTKEGVRALYEDMQKCFLNGEHVSSSINDVFRRHDAEVSEDTVRVITKKTGFELGVFKNVVVRYSATPEECVNAYRVSCGYTCFLNNGSRAKNKRLPTPNLLLVPSRYGVVVASALLKDELESLGLYRLCGGPGIGIPYKAFVKTPSVSSLWGFTNDAPAERLRRVVKDFNEYLSLTTAAGANLHELLCSVKESAEKEAESMGVQASVYYAYHAITWYLEDPFLARILWDECLASVGDRESTNAFFIKSVLSDFIKINEIHAEV